MDTPRWGNRGVGKRTATIFAVFLVVTALSSPARAQSEPGGSQYVRELAPVFEQLRAALLPVVPMAEQLGAAMSDLMASGESGAEDAGAVSASTIEPLVTQVSTALAALAGALQTADELLAPLKEQLEPNMEDASFYADTALFILKGPLDGAGPQTVGAAGPAISPLCAGKDYVKPVFAATPYGIVFDGFVIAFDETCASGAPATAPGVPSGELEPFFAEYTALLDEFAATLAPFGPVLQPAADPVCASAAPIFYGAALGAGALPLPFITTLSPVVLMCALGGGPDPLNDLIIVAAAATDSMLPGLSAASDAVTAASPIVAPLRPVLAPLAAPVCAYASAADLATGILIPPEIDLKPALYVTPVTSALCGTPKNT